MTARRDRPEGPSRRTGEWRRPAVALAVGSIAAALLVVAVQFRAGVAPPPSPAPAAATVAMVPATQAAHAPEPAFGSLRPVDCPPSSGAPRTCAYLRVPANWDESGREALDIFIMVLPAAGPALANDPLLVLNGGPGQAGSDEADFLQRTLATLHQRRTLVLVDQRGTGRSRPSLHCPNIDPVRFWYGGLTAADVSTCLAPVRAAGYRLQDFDTRQSAADLVALRGALGLERWNVLATSYGAVLARALLAADGGAVRSLVLNSPTTPDGTWLDLDRLTEIRNIFHLLVEDCAAQPACARSFPRLGATVQRVAAGLTLQPLTLRVRDPLTAAEEARTFDWPSVAGMLTMRLSMTGDIALMPATLDYLDRISSGRVPPDPRTLADILMPQPFWNVFRKLAYGLNLVVGCRENRPRIDAAAARAAASSLYPFVVAERTETDYDVACPVVDVPPAAPALYEPVSNDVPTMILVGAYDTLVPPSRAASLARQLHRSRIFQFRGVGHDVLSSGGCAASMVAAFVEDRDGAIPDCAGRFLPPRFRSMPLGQ